MRRRVAHEWNAALCRNRRAFAGQSRHRQDDQSIDDGIFFWKRSTPGRSVLPGWIRRREKTQVKSRGHRFIIHVRVGKAGRDCHAFTLVELLVVVAIIAILSGLLLPVIATAKSKARAAICLGNHKQLLLAWQLYVGDNEEKLPENSFNFTFWLAQDSTIRNWAAGLLSWEDNWRDNTNTSLLVPGLNGSLGPYSMDSAMYKCPSDKSETSFDGVRRSRVRSVMMNQYLSDTEAIKMGYNLPEWKPGFPSAEFYSTADFSRIGPADIFVFIDAHEDCVRDPSFLIRSHQTKVWTGDLPATRHGRSGTISFADGHAQMKRWNLLTSKPVERIVWVDQQQTPPASSNGDPVWIYEHATYRLEGYFE
jgi:prepilin-type N-terminal cleavage/methylation domain-containing protein/prepilin-type processing-associated H-X9-DG protein